MTAKNWIFAADGATDAFTVNGAGIICIRGGSSFGGGQVSLQSRLARFADQTLSNNTHWATVVGSDNYTTPVSFSVSGNKNIEYRVALSGSTAPSLNIDLEDNF